jgi:hypothetical protein
MSAEDHRHKAQHFLTLVRQTTDPTEKAKLLVIASLWMERAEMAEQRERIVQSDAALSHGRED